MSVPVPSPKPSRVARSGRRCSRLPQPGSAQLSGRPLIKRCASRIARPWRRLDTLLVLHRIRPWSEGGWWLAGGS